MVLPEDVDREFRWAPGTARRLARRGKLPHYVLPDGSIRFKLPEVEALVRHQEPAAPATTGGAA